MQKQFHVLPTPLFAIVDPYFQIPKLRRDTPGPVTAQTFPSMAGGRSLS